VLDKIDIRDILKDHFSTMISYGTGKRSLADYILFFLAPAALTGFIVWSCVILSDTAVNVLITAVSILAGLLFNVLVLIHTLADRFAPPTGKEDGRRFLREIYSNIAYAILICLLSLLPLVVLVVFQQATVRELANAVAIFLMLHLMLTLVMILKRLHALLSYDLGRPLNN
jgi:hypothetical protein